MIVVDCTRTRLDGVLTRLANAPTVFDVAELADEADEAQSKLSAAQSEVDRLARGWAYVPPRQS